MSTKASLAFGPPRLVFMRTLFLLIVFDGGKVNREDGDWTLHENCCICGNVQCNDVLQDDLHCID